MTTQAGFAFRGFAMVVAIASMNCAPSVQSSDDSLGEVTQELKRPAIDCYPGDGTNEVKCDAKENECYYDWGINDPYNRYSTAPKCVAIQGGSCKSAASLAALGTALAADAKKDKVCPGCPPGETGCEPSATVDVANVEERGGACCLKAGSVLGNESEYFKVTCGVCVTCTKAVTTVGEPQ